MIIYCSLTNEDIFSGINIALVERWSKLYGMYIFV